MRQREEFAPTLVRSFRNIIIAFILVCFIACKQTSYHYPQNREVSNEKGILNDSLGLYFSTFEPFDSSQLEFVNDTFWQNYFSANLYAFKEPILYNDYLGGEIYRFLWLRSFHLPMVFTLANDNEKITFTTKKLDRQPLFEDQRYVDIPEWDSNYIAQGYQPINEINTLKNRKPGIVTVVKADLKAKLIYDSTKILTQKDWNRFKKILRDAKFWSLTPYDWAGNTDGAAWIIEANTKNRYKYIVRQSPTGKLREIGQLMLELSGLKEEMY
ncbi:MAG: hypothetical protein M3352_02105 [Bacteroidota bacterium]|nr:hypothetical protein [Bacteroidota bacterium]